MNKIIKLSITDFKIIFRDPSLRAFLFLPILLFALIVWAVPLLTEKYSFLIPYLPLMIVVAVIENTQMFSFINTMVLIDEKETAVAKTYGIVPLSHVQYLVSRFLFPYLITVILNIILFAVQPFFTINWINNLIISLITGFVVPIYVLGINSLVKNRMQGMVYIKAFNMLVLIPIAAFFVPEKWKHLFGIFPTHWIFQSVEAATQESSFTLFALIGFTYMTGLLIWISRAFIRKHFI